VEEVEELRDALKGNSRKALEDKFADALAWLAHLANVVDIDLDRAATSKYDRKCPKSQNAPCNCSSFK